MKVTVKTLKGDVSVVSVEPEQKVSDLKTEIAKVKDVVVDKLIHQGKLLDDAKTMADYGVKDGDIVIMMVKKGVKTPTTPAAPTPAASSATPTPATPTASTTTTTANTPATPATPTTPTTTNPTAAGGAQATSSPGMLMGTDLQATVSQMCDMGFPRDQVMMALRAAFNNPDRAMQYLLDGIPSHLAQPAAQPAAPTATAGTAPAASPGTNPAPTTTPTTPATTPASPAGGPAAASPTQGGAAPAAGGEGGTPVVTQEALQQALGSADASPLHQAIPGLEQILQVVRNNPAALQPLLQELGRHRPDLLQLINENQPAFLQLLNSAGAGGGGGEGGPAPMQIRVTPEERAAMDRLMALGFPEHAVLEAYFSCDKNEELAANFLFENYQDM